MDVCEIVKIRTSLSKLQDFFAWHPEKRGQFSVKSAYQLATSSPNELFAVGASSSYPKGQRLIWNLISV